MTVEASSPPAAGILATEPASNDRLPRLRQIPHGLTRVQGAAAPPCMSIVSRSGSRAKSAIGSLLALSFVLAVSAFCVQQARGNQEDGHHLVPTFPAAVGETRQGFVRVINHSSHSGTVLIEAVDDNGTRFGPIGLAIGGDETVHFNSDDLEDGNAAKGMPSGTGAGDGDWWLRLSSSLDIEVLSYIRTPDGFLTSMHDTVPQEGGRHRVAFFNPGANFSQVSRLRLINPGQEAAEVTITGIDANGDSPGGAVLLAIPAGATRTLDAKELESGGAGLEGALGDGAGKWQLDVESEQSIIAMSLLSSPTGHLTNLSTAPANVDGCVHTMIPMFPAAVSETRQGFVRVINHSPHSGTVRIEAVDDNGTRFGPIGLAIGGDETVHFNSDDLEDGNAAKGMPSGTGAGDGDWWLRLSSSLDIEVLSYIRTPDGFLTSMHDTVPQEGGRHRVAFFNPGANFSQVSRLRLINPGQEAAEVTITGIDANGDSPGGAVLLAIPAGATRTLDAKELESGGAGLEGALGDGAGKWQLDVESEQSIIAMSLLSSPTGHLTNLSTAPAVDFAPADSTIFDDWVVGRRMVMDNPATYVDMLADERFRETRGTETHVGGYAYTRTGRNRATVVFDYDNGVRCTHRIVFQTRTMGATSFACDHGSNGSAMWLVERSRTSRDIPLAHELVNIPDRNLRAVVEHHLGKTAGQPISVSEMATLTYLGPFDQHHRPIFSRGGIGSLEGIQFATNLEELAVESNYWDESSGRWINMNEFSDLSPLARLTKLKRLNLGGSDGRVHDLSPLSDLTNLEEFHCWNCNITDLAPLSGLSALRTLSFGSNDHLSDLAPLSGLVNLVNLTAYYCNIEDVAPLSGLTNLEYLDLDWNRVSDISPLSRITKLSSLHLSGGSIADISALSGFTKLTELRLEAHDITDIGPLSGLTDLRELWLRNLA